MLIVDKRSDFKDYYKVIKTVQTLIRLVLVQKQSDLGLLFVHANLLKTLGRYTHLMVYCRQVHAHRSIDHLWSGQFPGEGFIRSRCCLRVDHPTTGVLVIKATFGSC